ncbi:putative SPT10-transcription regulatory protein [Trichophyton interdigitale]|uniref:SPT10-transcription regulatory protein n=1 Tax=Trichophyton interdigitale TaxID=101480 RepID=A0A9P5CUF2_9EURO|nr:putative SPT10-transcription regulatory protein [Trichophyton interdigitale]KAF3896252.1 putative SPT10-transcription regulatory protein [Trichophyton interdigitale]KAG8206613.1 putative SPT10-transcription regulatory protein [Trichophyton interdigitale]
MPAVSVGPAGDDPVGSPVYRTSPGTSAGAFHVPAATSVTAASGPGASGGGSGSGSNGSNGSPQLPPAILPRQVTLRDRVTAATLIPFSSAQEVPRSLLAYLCDQLNKEIEKGDTYPFLNPLSLEEFGTDWFSHFTAVMLLGDVPTVGHVQSLEAIGADWGKICLGSFNIKPNYPGRSSHICNGAFLVTDASRNRGVGRLMGECYLEWAPQMGYTYAVFNLVYETNVASCRIWDALGFKRVGRIPGCGNLRSYPGQLIDAIIYGRDLGPEGEDFVSEERFDKIRYYLKHSKYPSGADRAEKSRLRSAATHYKLVGGEKGEPEKLMLKDKEVVSDPQQQYEIARKIHQQQHGGINKTTATIALKYHWVRIKETVSMAIKNCPQCKEGPKTPINGANGIQPGSHTNSNSETNNLAFKREKPSPTSRPNTFDIPPANAFTPTQPDQQLTSVSAAVHQYSKKETFSPTPHVHPHNTHSHTTPLIHAGQMADYADIPLDPQIMDDIHHHLPPFQHHNGVNVGVGVSPYETDGAHDSHHALAHEFDHSPMQHHDHDHHHHEHHHHHDHTGSYQVVEDDDLMASHAGVGVDVGVGAGVGVDVDVDVGVGVGMRDQSMRLAEATRLQNDAQFQADLLTVAFGGRDDQNHFEN